MNKYHRMAENDCRYVPKGWARGEPLHVQALKYPTGASYIVRQGTDVSLHSRKPVTNAVYSIVFYSYKEYVKFKIWWNK